MTKIVSALLATAVLAAPAAALADAPAAVTPRPQPNSYAPGPRTHQHVYGSPIEPRHASAPRMPHGKAATKPAKTSSAHVARPHPTKGRQPAPAPAPAA